MLVTTQWPLERAAHLTSLVWVCVLWLPESLTDLSALWIFLIHFCYCRPDSYTTVCFYPRPVMACGHWRWLSVCPRVRQSQACPCNISSPVQARITKMQDTLVKMQVTLVKILVVLWGDWPQPSRWNWTPKSKLTPFWAWLRHNSQPIEAKTTKFRQKMQNTLVKILLFWRSIDFEFRGTHLLIVCLFVFKLSLKQFEEAKICICMHSYH